MFSGKWWANQAGAFALCLLCGLSVLGQSTSQSPPSPAGRVIRLKVGLKVEGQARLKGLARKRFFLIKGSQEENRNLIEQLKQQPPLARECYYRSIGASEPLIKWLRENDCESVYCREIAPMDVEGNEAVPEFQKAFIRGRKEFGSRELALKWLTVNLPTAIRIGYYNQQQSALQAFIKEAEESSKAPVMSVMTDRNGTAYFTDVLPGTYLISNILPTESGPRTILWTCQLKVENSAQGTEMIYTLSDREGKQVKCIGLEQTLPACQQTAKD